MEYRTKTEERYGDGKSEVQTDFTVLLGNRLAQAWKL
jgi:hypothetical protein